MSWLFSQALVEASLGGGLLGWRTVCAVERDAYAAQVLAQRQNDGILTPFPIWSDVTTFDGKPWKGIVDVISAGFPCQDISVAGNGKGISGGRSGLFSEVIRIARDVKPRNGLWLENSPTLTSRGLDIVLGELAKIGFDAEWGVLSAEDVGAKHIRERIWILAYPSGVHAQRRDRRQRQEKSWRGSRWPTEPTMDRVAYGVANRVDRLKAIGNGQVPRVAAAAFIQLATRAGIF